MSYFKIQMLKYTKKNLLALCKCETWVLTLKEVRRLNLFENKDLRKEIVSKREQVTGGRRILHSEEIHGISFHQAS